MGSLHDLREESGESGETELRADSSTQPMTTPGAAPVARSMLKAREGKRRSVGVWVLRGPIRFYQLAVSPMMPPACRYYPTCSNYAIEAIDKYGPLKGGWLAVRRILRCHPFRPGGFDPVP